MRLARQLAAVLVLPGVVAGVVPALIAGGSQGSRLQWGALGVLGAALVATGLLLIAQTVALFATEGRGTLAPWDPTRRLVVRGPYRRVRNPMISGVLAVLLGEAALLRSTSILLWFGVVLAINAAYFPLVEEPGLRRRFGAEYEAYRSAVPRWLPRLRPWRGPGP